MDKGVLVKPQAACCGYCGEPVQYECLQCGSCSGRFHLHCLHRESTPGGFAGDVFFSFTCSSCEGGSELFTRERISWFQVIVLVLHHLQLRSAGTSRNGYFHWRTHIACFIDQHWDHLLGPHCTKKKSWLGCVSGTLSHSNGIFFLSGMHAMSECGWWKLRFESLGPGATSILYTTLANHKKKLREANRYSEVADHNVVFRFMQDLGIVCREKQPAPAPALAQTDQMESCDDVVDLENVDDANTDTDSFNVDDVDDDSSGGSAFSWLVSRDVVKEQTASRRVAERAPLWRRNSAGCAWPWPMEGSAARASESTVPLRPAEEKDLAWLLAAGAAGQAAGAARLRCKLGARLAKRARRLARFDADAAAAKHLGRAQRSKPARTRDRLCHYNAVLPPAVDRTVKAAFGTRLCSGTPDVCFQSPHTGRWLKPFIWRDESARAAYPSLLAEIRGRPAEGCCACIDYLYVRPQHIAAINSLCERHFWPGIDQTLEYPDFTCVALYKKIVVGFAFLVPDVDFDEAYVSFVFVRPEWRRAGIAKFMLYHLTQTCSGKDITLHVSITNPAIFLYQEFGFKMEKLVLDFYDTFLPPDTFESKHAFFLRLSR